jgi:RNA polymerase sigma factor (TIGR02999 family)
MTEVTRTQSPDEQAGSCTAEQLLPLVYDALRQLAARKLAREKAGQTLQPTALVHEAYVRLLETRADCAEQRFDNPGHFFAAAAEAMRRILVDRARQKQAQKRGGRRKKLDVDAIDVATQASPDQLLALDDALARLARTDSPAARLVELRFFAGLDVEEAGHALGMSTATAYRHWKYARAWLHHELLGSEDD